MTALWLGRTLRQARAGLKRPGYLSISHQMKRFSTQSSVYTWGSGSLGQLGHGDIVKSGIRNTYEELSPKLVEFFEGKGITKLSLGVTHSAALDDSGRIYMWGSNEYKKLGLGSDDVEAHPEPKVMDAFEGIRITDISCGEYTSAAVDDQGKAYTWGWGGSTLKGAGGLGHAGAQDEPTPRLLQTFIDQGVPIASIRCGELHTVALTQDKELWAWGNGEYGRLGNGETVTFEVPEPVEYFLNEDIESFAVGRDFTFALTSSGELYSWGVNSSHQLGIGGGLAVDRYNVESIPTLVEGFNGAKVKQVAAGYNHAAAVTEDGGLYMWGSRLWLEPHEMTAVSDHEIVAVDCGRHYTAALSAQGTIFTFGKGSSTCLGNGERKNQLQPEPVASLEGIQVTSLACGHHHMGAIAQPHSNAMDKDFSMRE